MDGPVRGFYDELAGRHHLLFADWRQSMARQAAALDAVITAALGVGPWSLLDRASGNGKQAIGWHRAPG